MIEHAPDGQRAVLVHIDFKDAKAGVNAEDLREFRDLVDSSGAATATVVAGTRSRPDPKFFVGSGKAREIGAQAAANSAQLVIFDHALSPAQERNLEGLLQCRVLDRAGLILDIFAQRARSFEGKLQVELAQLTHLSTRLVRGWSHLERQKGGIGLRGPGETQLETDRRLIGARIKQINKRLDKVRGQREQGRRARSKAAVPTVSLVGYTNAGKSTLFNTLTAAGAYTADQLFATLDPTLRRLALGGESHVVLADTVGFVRHLPIDLIGAFRATLQETREADLLVHVVDAHDDQRDLYIDQVNQVLTEIGAERVPQLVVYNKIDLLDMAPRCERDADQRVTRVWLSAETGAGVALLREALAEIFHPDTVHAWLELPPQAGRARSRLFAMGAVLREHTDNQGACHLEVQMPRRHFEAFSRREGLSDDRNPA